MEYRTVLRIWKKIQEAGQIDIERRGGYKSKSLSDAEIQGIN